MATTRQKKAAKLIVENLKLDKPLTGGEIVESSGYGVSMKKNPQVVLDSEGVKEELKVHYGFDPDRAKEVVGEILEAGENDIVKLKAADMIFKVHSTYAPEKKITVNLNQTDNRLDAIIEQIEATLDDPEGTTISS